MKVMELAPEVFATGQLSTEDLKLIAEQGVRSVINNRPDHEEAGQPLSDDLRRAAESLGIRYVHMPVVSGAMTPKDIDDFRGIYRDIEKPLLVFCRTGARSAHLFRASGAE